ncbi:hypothetical protein [Pseudomonas sp. NFPP24]|uniref:hypothetical protein n=1 Tax=Pseudomonas sp. NFPP24 TaxID=1566228 RepID=UPI0008E29C90|nr:hypothetical protein [Pseudomonas sp. NFPP24]SFA81780.1 hypothetical protein SAMN03159485_00791 [Pseudomonas sp. NFPP24]
MHVEYTRENGPIWSPENILGPEDGDIGRIIKNLGYVDGFHIGNSDVASIEFFNRSKNNTKFAAIAVVILAEAVDIYAFPTNEDAWDYLQKFVPTVKAMSELSQMTF